MILNQDQDRIDSGPTAGRQGLFGEAWTTSGHAIAAVMAGSARAAAEEGHARNAGRVPVKGRQRNRALALVVDDDEGVRTLTKVMLEDLGFAVVAAADGRQALAVFERLSTKVAFVVLDVVMPGMNGVETLRAMRRMNADVPVILFTGQSETDVHRRLNGDLPDGFLAKPFTRDGMQEQILHVLSARVRESCPAVHH